ncbi:D-glycerate dehydrogenase [Bacteriovorax sp. Seq25_V]|uniref:2-hydroxyacid dehydrogenase n=1 Tax=Bacteriovorax sp. Seq25_V TaxID=1201288 RepID=UPI000389F86A|nr:D-glycerate dehydrogenase [Bacteriovorax sp. Seq25_V]EQC47677.1 glyoxylate reductase [Bacteriovorax sp. Seq25_V]
MAHIFCTKTIIDASFKLLLDSGHSLEVWDDKRDGPISYDILVKKASQADALITMLSDKIDKNLLDQCPKLKVISQYAVGINNIDLKECENRAIKVFNTPDVLTDASAELGFALLLACARKIIPAYENAKQGKWRGWEPMGFLGKSLKGLKLGIIGPGKIGQEFARLCAKGLEMEVSYFGPSEKPEFAAKRVDLTTLLKDSDIISIHCPLTDDTRELIGENELRQMKADAILINTARGEVINQDALVKVLKEGHLHSVGLDVTSPEPLSPEHELFQLSNVLIMPHIASATVKARIDMANLVCENINNFI